MDLDGFIAGLGVVFKEPVDEVFVDEGLLSANADTGEARQITEELLRLDLHSLIAVLDALI